MLRWRRFETLLMVDCHSVRLLETHLKLSDGRDARVHRLDALV